ncbi:NAD(P)H-dependent oxidoreductase [Paenibacillus sp. MWE-103]|uniref:NAD(P)H-dependent oxidoreductase n=1 Tax=Paenibacillus artemisiicola TaxID=1172618 RepID=A0ABS3WFE5_9BACL|nr:MULTISPECIES: NAD(P)H-dependent oxidoreductase [Paenibacillus]MBO7747033.1 NAD(P)H-dependent oxidoreductase [Paenibacillus artemisiicola]SFJ54084.1 NAD(P)H-dependent FMN reductase [Paenibacillus sp. UNC496MF]
MIRIGIIIGSTRPERKGETIARWVYDIAQKRSDAEFALVDLLDYHLPQLDEPVPGQYTKDHTKRWANTIASFDGFVFVTPEYNHATSGVLKNALDFIYYEWNNKAAGFVGYGSLGGARAVENLRLIAGELQMADVRTQVGLSLYTDFVSFSVFRPDDRQVEMVNGMLNQVIAWSGALKTLRDR